MPLEMDRIDEELSLCDLFVSIGTSGSVHWSTLITTLCTPGMTSPDRALTVIVPVESSNSTIE